MDTEGPYLHLFQFHLPTLPHSVVPRVVLGSAATPEARVRAPSHQAPHAGLAQGEELPRRPPVRSPSHRGLVGPADAQCVRGGRVGRCLRGKIASVGHTRPAVPNDVYQMRRSARRSAGAVQRVHPEMVWGQGWLAKPQLAVGLGRPGREAYAGIGQRR
ncbi:hypothetical protein BC827DRAFT_1190547 [Russula dissimulans]|nr:hypothetical protein BC827DRAFT_1190547 [Russula dissimulans]